jgi:hypothetical protein
MPTSDPISIDIEGDPQDFVSALNKAGVEVDDFSRKVERGSAKTISANRMGGRAFFGFAAAAAAATAVIGVAMKGIGEAGEKEQFETQFETLLGSADAAKERMAELAKFANETPFSNKEVVEMSKQLQAMAGNALSTGDGLRLVGDTAAALNPERINEFSMHIGRVYSKIQSGQAFGESLQELQQLGAISGPVANQLRDLSESGQVNAETWKIVEKELLKNKGAMERLAGTWGGAKSTVLGVFNDVLADAFRPVTDALTPLMFSLVDGMEAARPVLVSIGESIGVAVSNVRNAVVFMFAAFKGGDLGATFLTGLQLAGASFVNWFFGLLGTGFNLLANLVTGTFRLVSSGAFWVGVLNAFASLGDIIRGVVAIFIGGVLQAGQGWYSTVLAAVVTMGTLLAGASVVAGTTLFSWILQGAEKLLEVGRKLKIPGIDAMVSRIQEARGAVEGVRDAAAESISNPKEIFDGAKETVKAGMDNVGKAMAETGKELITQGVENAKGAGAGLGGAVGDSFHDVMDGVDLAPADIIDTDGMKKELADTVGKYWPEEAAKDTKKNAKETGEAVAKAIDPNMVADSMAKIGGGGNVFTAAIEAARQAGPGGSLGGAGLSTTGSALAGAGSGSSALGQSGTGRSAELAVLENMLSTMRSVRDILAGGGGGGGSGAFSVQLIP